MIKLELGFFNYFQYLYRGTFNRNSFWDQENTVLIEIIKWIPKLGIYEINSPLHFSSFYAIKKNILFFIFEIFACYAINSYVFYKKQIFLLTINFETQRRIKWYWCIWIGSYFALNFHYFSIWDINKYLEFSTWNSQILNGL